MGNKLSVQIDVSLSIESWYIDITIGSRIAKSNNVKKDYKAPPTLVKDTLYVNWRKEIRIRGTFTSVTEEKRVPADFYDIKYEAREAILTMEIEVLTSKTGVMNLLDENVTKR